MFMKRDFNPLRAVAATKVRPHKNAITDQGWRIKNRPEGEGIGGVYLLPRSMGYRFHFAENEHAYRMRP